MDVPEEKKVCPITDCPLVKIGEEITYKLAHKPGSYYLKKIIRPKYARPTGEGIVTAELPECFIPKCRAAESLLADVLTKKFADHLPLYRICKCFEREGIGISRKLLSQWVVRIGLALEPLYQEILKKVLESNNVFADETTIDLQHPGQVHTAYMWVMVGGRGKDPPYRVYAFRENRNHENIHKLLKDYRGVLHSDKYGAYETLANQKQITWVPCWSHIRRKFFEAEAGDPVFREWVLRKIRYLFMLEKVAWARCEDERLRIRQEKEVPIIDELSQAIKEKLTNGKVLPKSKFREALGYFCGLIPHLKITPNIPGLTWITMWQKELFAP